jgi:hypothetical protein
LSGPRSRRKGQAEVLEPSISKYKVRSAKPPRVQQPAIPEEPNSTVPVFARIAESEPTPSFDRKQPYKKPIKAQAPRVVNIFDGNAAIAHGRPSNTSTNTDTMYENVKERDNQEPKYKRLVLTVPKSVEAASECDVAERLETLPQFIRDLSAGLERHEAPEVEEVIPYVCFDGLIG